MRLSYIYFQHLFSTFIFYIFDMILQYVYKCLTKDLFFNETEQKWNIYVYKLDFLKQKSKLWNPN